MRLHRWSRGEKALFLIPAVFIGAVTLSQAVMADRQFRFDVFSRRYNFLIARRSDCGRVSCSQNQTALMLATLQYQRDFDDKFPVPGAAGQGWAVALGPYKKVARVYYCPAVTGMRPLLANGPGYTDYFFNANLYGLRSGSVTDPAGVVLFGEGGGGDEGNDASYAKYQVPLAWSQAPNSPAFRHLQETVLAAPGSFYVFADGHRKFVTPKKLPGLNFKPH